MEGNNSAHHFKYLKQILNDHEIVSMTSYVKIKIESHLEGKQLSIDDMKNQLENSVANAEKKSFAIDRELQNIQSKLSMSEDFADKLKTQLKEAEEALQKSRHDYYDILQCRDALTYELNVYKEKAERFSQEKLDLTDLLDRRLEEIKCLQSEIKHLSSKLQVNSEGRIESTIKAEEIEMRMLSVNHQEMRMSQERQLYQKQVATLNDELNQKINELSTLRRDRAIQIFELQSNLEQKTEEHSKCIDEVKHLKQVVDKKDKHIDSLATRMREMQQYSVQLEEDYQNEITAQNNLIELHKQSSNDFKKRNESLVETIEEMQTILQSAKQAHTELETMFNESQLKFSQQINASNEEINMLRKELEEAKQSVVNTSRENLEEEIEKYFPAAAATNKILRSNISLSYIYSEYVRVQQEFEDEKCENSRLKENMQALVSEAEENAPLLSRKIHEHQKALQTIVDLKKQVSALTENNEKYIHEIDTLVRMNNQFQREIKRFELENLDLSKQIRHLIKNLEEARGFNVSFEQEDVITSTGDHKSLIPNSLITFSSIEDLQSKNKQLMRSLRDANEKIEAFEKENSKELTANMQKNLDDSLLQLEHLITERRQQTEMVEALVQQRDLYKLMATHSTESSQQRSPVAYTSATFSASNRVSDEYNELKLNFEKISVEYANFREETGKNLTQLRENNEKLREDLSLAKIESAKFSSELSFTHDRLEMFKTNMEQFQRENVLLRERNTALNEIVKKHEQSIVSMRSDMLSTQDNLHRLEITNESLKAERDLYRNNELKLLQEKEIMIRDSENQNRLIATLQSVNSNLDKLETETINSLKSQLEKTERECSYLRNKCEKEQQRYNEVNKLLEKNLQDLHEKFDKENDKYLKTYQDLTNAQIKIEKLETELSSLKSVSNDQIENTRTESDSDEALTSQISVMREQYLEAQNEIKLLRDKAENSRKSCDNLKTLNFVLEEKLNEHKMTTSEIQTQTSTILVEKETIIANLKKEIFDTKEKYAKIREEKISLENDFKRISEEQKIQIKILNESLIEANNKTEKALLSEARAVEDKNVNLALYNEAQANYEKELRQHSNELHNFNLIRKQLDTYQMKVIEAESAANKAQEQLTQSHEIWNNDRKTIELNFEKIKQKCSDLERINDTLNEQIELLSTRIIALQNNSSMPLSSQDEAQENANKLLEVIKFLRKEKEILQTQISALNSEDSRIKLVLENIKKELIHTQNELREEKNHSKSLMNDTSQHNELIKKIEMINILSESNSMLRNEKNMLETKCNELASKLNKIDYESKSKEFDELNLKCETITAENHALKDEVKHWQKRANTLIEQINKTNSDDVKRLNEEKMKLNQQIINLTQELSKLSSEIESLRSARRFLETQMQNAKTELDSQKVDINKLTAQLTSSQLESENSQKTIIQLRKVARKYKTQYDELKVEFDQFKEIQNKVALPTNTTDSSETQEQIDARNNEFIKKIDEMSIKIQELEQQNEKLSSDLNKVSEEKEEAKMQANEKEEKTKRIAQQAKIRIASITSEKANLIREKESVEKNLDESQIKIRLLEQNAEETALRLASFKSQFDSKMSRKERELSDANKQVEELKLKLQTFHSNASQMPAHLQSQPLHQQTPTIGVAVAVQPSSQSSVTPVRHSVHPQQSVSTKSTPTASIKPLAIGVTHAHRSPRATVSQSQSRTATVATVQPTTEEPAAHQSVPQATVQPTQTSQINMVVVAPTANSEQQEIITAFNDEDFRDVNEEQNISESNSQPIFEQIDDIIPSTVQEGSSEINYDRENDESNNDAGSSEPLFLTQEIKDKTTIKRSLNISDDELNSKKQRTEIELEGVRPETDEISQQNLYVDKSKYSVPILAPELKAQANIMIDRPNINVDDDEIIILSDESDDEKVKSEPEEVEEDEEEIEDEEDYDDEPNPDVEVDASDDGFEQEEREEFNEEASNDDDEARDDRSDSNRYNEEEVEIIASDAQEDDDSNDEINGNSAVNQHPISENVGRNEDISNVSVAPIRHNQPFIQIPTPIQRQFVRQSFYHQTQSTYDEGDGIVPSTPTLFVPRRDDNFQEALNSPRVPQSRFVFSSSIPESSTLSQLATEGTLGVDDTRMDLSQFDDNGRNVPTTPVSIIPVLESNLAQSGDIVSDLTHANNPTAVSHSQHSSQFDNENSESSRINIDRDGENSKTSSKDNSIDNSNTLEEGISGNPIILVEEEVSEQEETDGYNQSDANIDQNIAKSEVINEEENASTSTSATDHPTRQLQTARRGRGFAPQRVLQRRPIVWPSSAESAEDSAAAKDNTNTSSNQSQQQTGRRIRLRGASSKFSNKEVYRGGRGGGSGSRGAYH